MSPRNPTWYARGSVLAVVGLAVVLAGVNITSWVLYDGASAVVDRELDRRLIAIGKTAAPGLTARLLVDAPDRAGASRDLATLRDALTLEQAFVFDRAQRSVADARARVRSGTRYDPLRLRPAGVEAALAGRPLAAPGFSVDGLAFKGAYVPLFKDGAVEAVLYLEAGVAMLSPLEQMSGLLTIGTLASAVLGLLIAGLLMLGIRAARREISAASRAEHLGIMARLAAQAAHEIKNPLSTIQASAEAVEELADLDPDSQAILRDVRSDVARISRLVEDFVALSPQIALRRQPVDLDELVASTARRHREALLAAGIELHVERPDAPVMVRVDGARIRQILVNLLLNAEQATPRGGRVRVALAVVGPDAVVTIEDTGRGIPASQLERIWDPFFTTRDGGTGLGLAVARQLVEAHGGQLTLTSQVGQGTRCQLSLARDAEPGV